MEERSKTGTTFRLSDEGKPKITVPMASSTENDIRFYLNDADYIKATNVKDKIIVERVEILKGTTEKKISLLEDIKNNKRFCLLSVVVALSFILVVALMQVGITVLIGNIIFSSLWFLFAFPMCYVLLIGFMEYKITTPSIKSKHSAEHMMVNFLEKNCRLPKNLQEIRSTSRFNKKCGSRYKTLELMQPAIIMIVSIVISTVILTIIFHNTKNINGIVLTVMSIITSLVVYFINVKLAEKGLYNFIVNPIQLGLNYFLQCCNTTNKVKDSDILLAFYAAKFWMKIVYPEFYSNDELYCEKDESENV